MSVTEWIVEQVQHFLSPTHFNFLTSAQNQNFFFTSVKYFWKKFSPFNFCTSNTFSVNVFRSSLRMGVGINKEIYLIFWASYVLWVIMTNISPKSMTFGKCRIWNQYFWFKYYLFITQVFWAIRTRLTLSFCLLHDFFPFRTQLIGFYTASQISTNEVLYGKRDRGDFWWQ